MNIETIPFLGWEQAVRLANDRVEVVVLVSVGPRIIHFGRVGGSNLLYVASDTQGKTGGDTWNIYGGHRLWHAPEAMPRTYAPDNSTVAVEVKGNTVVLRQATEEVSGIRKEMEVTLEDGRSGP